MASLGFKGFVGIAIAGSMLASSTVATAAGSAPVPQISPWATLTVLSGGAPAAALCGAAAAAAAQPGPGCVLPVMDAPPPVPVAGPPAPVPPVEAPAAGFGAGPLLLGLVAIAAAAGLFFAVKNHNHHNLPNSPG